MKFRRAKARVPYVALDTETTGLNVWTGDRPFAVSACWPGERTDYEEVDVDPFTARPKWSLLSRNRVREWIRRARRHWFWHAKFDWLMLDAEEIEVPLSSVDELLFQAKAVNNLEYSYELKFLSKKYVELPDDDQDLLHAATVKARRVAKKLGWLISEEVEQSYWMPRMLAKLHPKLAREQGIKGNECEIYARRDSLRALRLGEMYSEAMDDLGVRKVYEREMELWPVTLDMERTGVRVDPERMKKVSAECRAVVKKYRRVLEKASGNPDFNTESVPQIVKLLFEGPNALPVSKRTEKGQPKTGAEALAEHKNDPRVEALFRVRANTKANSTFLDKYARLATLDDLGQTILHPGCRQWGTLTSRYSMTEPNLHGVSDPDTSNSLMAEFMVDIRQVFIPRKGKVWYCPDYKQVEVIIFASVSGEESLLEAIRNGDDIHAATADKVWGGEGNPRGIAAAMELLKTRDEGRARALLQEHNWSITKAEESLDKKVFRKRSKSVTFAKIFGGKEGALMRWINVGRAEATSILNAYDDAFPTMISKMQEIEREGRANGHIFNSFGVRLAVDRFNAYRAVNHWVQSDAAQLMKMGMRKAAAYLRDTDLDAKILLTIHDELIFEFRKEHAFTHILRNICRLMSDHEGVFSVPTPVSMDKVTERWSEKEKVDLREAA